MKTVKINRREYTLKNGDKFLDNGSCVQLLTQSKEKTFEYSKKRPNPVVGIRLWKEILKETCYIKTRYESFSGAYIYELKGN